MTDSSASRNVEAPSREELVAFVREQRDNCYRLGKNGEGLADLFERLGYKDSVALYEGVRTRIEELSRELAVSDKLLEERNRVLRAIPGCDAHGDQCVPHALEWIEDALRAAKSAERTSEPVAWRSRLLLDLDRMIESVNEDIQKEAGNYGTLAHLGGELKGLMAARAYAELDSARSAIRTTAPTPPSDAGKDAEDAKRYRWLRREDELIGAEPFICRRNGDAFTRWTGIDADSAIDAAIAAAPAEGEG